MEASTLERFRQKTTEFLRARENDLVIQKLRHREALTEGDLEELQKVLVEQGGDKGEDLLSQLLSEQGQNVAEFARSIVGLDRKAASEPFARFLDQANFNARQIRFVEMIVDFVTLNGKLEAKQLYETPFTDDGSVESIFPNEEDADAIFELVLSQPDKVRLNSKRIQQVCPLFLKLIKLISYIQGRTYEYAEAIG